MLSREEQSKKRASKSQHMFKMVDNKDKLDGGNNIYMYEQAS